MRFYKQSIWNDFSLKLFVISYIFFFCYGTYNLPVTLNLLLWVIGIVLLLTQKKINRLNAISACLLVMSIVVLANLRSGHFIARGSYYLVTILAAVIFLISFAGKEKDLNHNIYLLLIPACLVSFVVILYEISPNLYIQIVEKYFSEEQILYNQRLISEGYAPSLGVAIGETIDYVVLAIFLLISQKKNFRKKHVMILVSVFFGTILFFGRRGELIALLSTVTIIMFLKSSFIKKRNIILLFLMFLIIAFTVIPFLIPYIIDYSGENRFIKTISELLLSQDISNGRSRLYPVALAFFIEHPLVGIGWGEFAETGSKIITITTNVHNIYLQLLCETGIIGTTFFLGAMFVIFYTSYILWKGFQKKENSWCLTFSLMVQIYIFIKGLVDNPIYYNNFWIVYLLAILPVQYFYLVKGKSKRA